MATRHLEERALDKYFDSIRSLPLLSPDEEKHYGRMWQDERNPEGLRKLVEGNLRYVVKESKKFEGMGLDLLDVIGEGNLGLIEAAKRFDPARKNKFLTYASWWVRQAIFHALAEHGSKIRLPQKVAGHLVKMNRVTRHLGQEFGRLATVEEISDSGNLSIEEVERLQYIQRITSVVSTEQSAGETDITLGDSLEQHVEPSALNTMDNESFHEQIDAFLNGLSEKEHTILTRHFGLGETEPMTLEEIGRSFNPPISRERVRQIEERAFARIRERGREVLGQFLEAALA